MPTEELPSTAGAPDQKSGGLASESLAIAVGTAISRITGAGRIIVGAAVLGPTIIGDLFLAINILPLTLVGIFGGPAVTSVLVPPLARRLADDERGADRFVSAVMGMTILVLGAITTLLVVTRGVFAGLFAGGAAPEDREHAIGIASDLIALMVPQVTIYGMIAVLVATQHARQRFLVPSFAPAIENMVLIVALLAMKSIIGEQGGAGVEASTVLFLSAVSWLALLTHLGLQWLGAVRSGARVRAAVPWGGRLHGLAELASPMRHSFVWTAANGALQFATIVVAGYAALGGIQAMEIAVLVAVLPAAVVGYPIAAAVLPRLARDNPQAKSVARAVTDGSLVALWALVPFAAAMFVFARPIAQALAFGEFDDDLAIELTVMALRGMSVVSLATSLFEIARQGTMAWGELAGLGRSIWVSLLVAVAGYAAAIGFFDGPNMLLAVGLALSASVVVALLVLALPLFEQAQVDTGRVRREIVHVVLVTAVALLVGLVAQSLADTITTSPQIAIVIIAVGFLVAFVAASRGGKAVRSLIADLEQVGA